MKIWVIGDSHVRALRQGWERMEKPDHEIKFGTVGMADELHTAPAFYEERHGKVYVTKEHVMQKLCSVVGQDHLQPGDALYGVCMGTHLPRIFRSTGWQKFAPWSVAEEVGLQPLSAATLESFFAHELQHVLGFFEALNRCRVRFFVLSGPPPRRGHKAMAERGTPRKVVIEVTKLYGEYFREQLRARAIQLIDAPDGIADDDGFLKAEYERKLEGDESHANATYGELHMRKMLAELEWLDTKSALT
jgi:hypothetical protein